MSDLKYKKNTMNKIILVLLFFVHFLISSKFYADTKIEQGMKKMDYALGEMGRRNYKKALSLFLNCYDNASMYGKDFLDIRDSFLLIYLKKMISLYPPTKNEIVKRYNTILEKIDRGSFKRSEICPIVGLAEILKFEKQLSVFFEKLSAKKLTEEKLSIVTKVFYRVLFKYKKYRDIYMNMDLVGSAKKLVSKCKKDMFGEILRNGTIDILTEYVLILNYNKDISKVRIVEKMIDDLKQSKN